MHDVVRISTEKRAALLELLREYGPYRRDQLRLKLLSKASLLREEADSLARSRWTAAIATPRLGIQTLRSEATELEEMARLVRISK